MKEEGKDFFWPKDPSHRGYFQHRFRQQGLFAYRTLNEHIGIIHVQPQIQIHPFPVFADQLSKLHLLSLSISVHLGISVLKMKRDDLIEFQWKMSDSPGEPILLTIDAHTSVLPDCQAGLTQIFQCCQFSLSLSLIFLRSNEFF